MSNFSIKRRLCSEVNVLVSERSDFVERFPKLEYTLDSNENKFGLTNDQQWIYASRFRHSGKRTVFTVEISTTKGKDLTSGLAAMLEAAAKLYFEYTTKQSNERLEFLVAAFSPNIPAPQNLIQQAEIIAKNQSHLVRSTPWITGLEVSKLAGFKTFSANSGPNRWKKQNKIFSVKYKGKELFPVYCLDKYNGYKPIDGLQATLEAFNGNLDNWEIARWFAGSNSLMNYKCPKDVIHLDANLVFMAATEYLKIVADFKANRELF